jgi:hypothetical protein
MHIFAGRQPDRVGGISMHIFHGAKTRVGGISMHKKNILVHIKYVVINSFTKICASKLE